MNDRRDHPGPVGSWCLEFSLGSAIFVAVSIFGLYLISLWEGRSNGVSNWATRGSLQLDEALRIAVVTAQGMVLMALLAPLARALAITTWRRVHPAVAMLWGPIFGGAVSVATLVLSVWLVALPVPSNSEVLGALGFGAAVAAVPWPIYLLLRMRGRQGWAAVGAALVWLSAMWLAAVVLGNVIRLLGS